MFRCPLFQCRLGMIWSVILLLLESVCGDYTPSCEDVSESQILLVKVTSWSSCTNIDETDGSRPGCYSGRQERLVQIALNSSSEIFSGNRKTQCTEYRRCLVPGRICEGVWSLWEESTCNCSTKSKTQTRYCKTRQPETASASHQVPSIHCLGSFGRFDSNRTSSCKPEKDNCKPITRKRMMKPTEESTIIVTYKPTSPSPATSASSDIFSDEVILNTTTKIYPRGVELAVTPSLEIGHFVAIAAGGMLTILVVIFAIHFWRRRRAKLLEKEERRNSAANSQHTEELAERSHNDERCYARNDLYQDTVDNANLEIVSTLSNDHEEVVSASAGMPVSPISQADAYIPPSNGVEDTEGIYWSIVT